MAKLPIPPKKAIIYQDKLLYVCLASFPITKGHCIVVWKKPAKDISLLSCDEYEYLMDAVDITRDALLKTLGIKKIYLLYIDEVQQVHWHLVPRYNEKGLDVLSHKPKRLKDFSLAESIKKRFRSAAKSHQELSRKLA